MIGSLHGSTRRSGSESVAFVLEQPTFDRDRVTLRGVHEPTERTLASDDAMTRDDEGDVVCTAGATDGTRCGVELPREFAVSSRFAD